MTGQLQNSCQFEYFKHLQDVFQASFIAFLNLANGLRGGEIIGEVSARLTSSTGG